MTWINIRIRTVPRPLLAWVAIIFFGVLQLALPAVNAAEPRSIKIDSPSPSAPLKAIEIPADAVFTIKWTANFLCGTATMSYCLSSTGEKNKLVVDIVPDSDAEVLGPTKAIANLIGGDQKYLRFGGWHTAETQTAVVRMPKLDSNNAALRTNIPYRLRFYMKDATKWTLAERNVEFDFIIFVLIDSVTHTATVSANSVLRGETISCSWSLSAGSPTSYVDASTSYLGLYFATDTDGASTNLGITSLYSTVSSGTEAFQISSTAATTTYACRYITIYTQNYNSPLSTVCKYPGSTPCSRKLQIVRASSSEFTVTAPGSAAPATAPTPTAAPVSGSSTSTSTSPNKYGACGLSKTCSACSGECRWCSTGGMGDSGVCMPASGSTATCASLNGAITASVDLCPKDTCAALTSCTTCAATGCSFCGSAGDGGICTGAAFDGCPSPFESLTPTSVQGSCPAPCSSLTSCNSCLGSSSCSWCEGAGTCIAKSASCALGKAITGQAASCPAPDSRGCSKLTSCSSCFGVTNCQWCGNAGDAGQCLPVEDMSPDPNTGKESKCSSTSKVLSLGACPALCSAQTQCSGCTGKGCKYCGGAGEGGLCLGTASASCTGIHASLSPIVVPAQCPATCTSHTTCASCAVVPGCAWTSAAKGDGGTCSSLADAPATGSITAVSSCPRTCTSILSCGPCADSGRCFWSTATSKCSSTATAGAISESGKCPATACTSSLFSHSCLSCTGPDALGACHWCSDSTGAGTCATAGQCKSGMASFGESSQCSFACALNSPQLCVYDCKLIAFMAAKFTIRLSYGTATVPPQFWYDSGVREDLRIWFAELAKIDKRLVKILSLTQGSVIVEGEIQSSESTASTTAAVGTLISSLSKATTKKQIGSLMLGPTRACDSASNCYSNNVFAAEEAAAASAATSSGVNGGAVAGGVIAAIVFIAAVFFLVWWFVIRKPMHPLPEGMKYHAFISYRRDDGVDRARGLQSLLARHQFKAFFDARSLGAGDFGTQLTSALKSSVAFISVLYEHTLDRARDPVNGHSDWVRIEIVTALKEKKTIIPVFDRVFKQKDKMLRDEELPEEMRGFTRNNAVFFDAIDGAEDAERKIVHFVSDAVQALLEKENRRGFRALFPFSKIKQPASGRLSDVEKGSSDSLAGEGEKKTAARGPATVPSSSQLKIWPEPGSSAPQPAAASSERPAVDHNHGSGAAGAMHSATAPAAAAAAGAPASIASGVHPNQFECPICLAAKERRFALVPCGHVACAECAASLMGEGKPCHGCRGAITGLQRVFE